MSLLNSSSSIKCYVVVEGCSANSRVVLIKLLLSNAALVWGWCSSRSGAFLSNTGHVGLVLGIHLF